MVERKSNGSSERKTNENFSGNTLHNGVDDLGRSSGSRTWFLEGKPGIPTGIVDLRKWSTSFMIRVGSQ